jgi:hypothetical protein
MARTISLPRTIRAGITITAWATIAIAAFTEAHKFRELE